MAPPSPLYIFQISRVVLHLFKCRVTPTDHSFVLFVQQSVLLLCVWGQQMFALIQKVQIRLSYAKLFDRR